MKIKTFNTDVLVVGAGLGGILATSEIILKNKNLIIATSGDYCSGASFYSGTWGLGMVGPKGKGDLDNFVDCVNRVGANIPDEKLVKTLLKGIDGVIEKLEHMGVSLIRPEKEDTVVPCFDNKDRLWYGFNHESARKAFKPILDKDNVKLLKYVNLIKIITFENTFKSALFIDNNGEYFLVKAKALILASGGFTNIYKHNVASKEMGINLHIPALEAGCTLINMEFIQFIPSHLGPKIYYKSIFNERAFNYIDLIDKDGENLIIKYFPKSKEEILKLKDERSGHGPFTSRLSSKIFDISMFMEYKRNKTGGYFKYPSNIYDIDDTLIQNYFKWFNSGEAVDEQVEIIPFAHAANGGISINEKGETGVNGIYAAGEVTGGMHGADRIGGLSTLNAAVFGIVSAINVLEYIEGVEEDLKEYDFGIYIIGAKSSDKTLTPELVIEEIRQLLFENGAIIRREDDLQSSLRQVERIKDNYNIFNHLEDPSYRKEAYQAENYIKLAEVLLNSMNNRKESRGSHFREDYPEKRNEYEHPQRIKYTDKKIRYYFK